MAKFFVFFLVCLTHSLQAYGTRKHNCDYSFGDSTWKYSNVFYDKQINFPAGVKTHAVILPAEKGLMISYVCITLPSGVDKDNIKAEYQPLNREVSVTLEKPATKEFKYHVVAKRHGY